MHLPVAGLNFFKLASEVRADTEWHSQMLFLWPLAIICNSLLGTYARANALHTAQVALEGSHTLTGHTLERAELYSLVMTRSVDLLREVRDKLVSQDLQNSTRMTNSVGAPRRFRCVSMMMRV